MAFAVEVRERPQVHVEGDADLWFPVRRIFCVGRNYADHVREMGSDPAREPPIFFGKPADAVVAAGVDVPYPTRTANFHYEVELVVAVGKGGRSIPADRALDHVFGYAVGIDLTRRDLQAAAKEGGNPWDTCKGFDYSAPIAPIRPVTNGGHVSKGTIWLDVNGKRRQDSDVSELIYGIPEIIAELSTWFELAPGDLIFTGTPAGVGPLKPGDHVTAGVADLPPLSLRIGAALP